MKSGGLVRAIILAATAAILITFYLNSPPSTLEQKPTVAPAVSYCPDPMNPRGFTPCHRLELKIDA